MVLVDIVSEKKGFNFHCENYVCIVYIAAIELHPLRDANKGTNPSKGLRVFIGVQENAQALFRNTAEFLCCINREHPPNNS